MMQGTETIENWGLVSRSLAVPWKELDCLLKVRFFQRNLGAPKPAEFFGELYDRARTLERHKKQFSESAAGRDKKAAAPR